MLKTNNINGFADQAGLFDGVESAARVALAHNRHYSISGLNNALVAGVVCLNNGVLGPGIG